MGRNWTKDEEILALALYCKVPFGKIHSGNPLVKELASMLERTPSSVSMKMCNLARFDPMLQARGVGGLKNGSRLDEEVWKEYSMNLEALEKVSKGICRSYGVSDATIEEVFDLPSGDEIERIVKSRVNQNFFRKTVLTSYESTCCITGIDVPALLNASHIKPWKDSDPLTERTNPQNGLCLNALHDKAFDRGLITIDSDYRVVLSTRLKDEYASDIISEYFCKYEGMQIRLPHRFLPSQKFISFHNEYVFK